MAQHDYVAANGSGAVVRGDFNDALLAVATMNSGATAPSVTYSYMPYVNTSDGHLYQRNAANTAWIDHGTVASRLLRLEDVAAGGSGGLLRADGDGSGLTGIATDAQYPPGFIYNAQVTLNASEPTTDIDVPKYSLRNDGNGANIDVASAMTKQADVTFAEGTNAGGMASGESVPTSGFFYLFSVTKDSDGTVDSMFDTSSTGANVNTGWTVEKLLARFQTDGSANIIKVVNYWLEGRYVFDSAPQTVTTSGTLSLSHGLASRPNKRSQSIVCVTAEAGYAIGDEITANNNQAIQGSLGATMFVNDDANIKVRYGLNSNVYSTLNNTNGQSTQLTNANWKLIVRAEL